jgi:hypothetical protein
MKGYVAAIIVFGLVACTGCTSSSTSSGSSSTGGNAEKKSPDKKSGGNDLKPASQTKRANPLVGKWTVTKSNKHWAENVSKQAVIEFLSDGETPNTGTMTITNNNNITADADYMWQGDMFVFQAKFTRPNGMKNGYGAQVKIEKRTENEIVADVFTLKRIQ